MSTIATAATTIVYNQKEPTTLASLEEISLLDNNRHTVISYMKPALALTNFFFSSDAGSRGQRFGVK